MGLADFIRGMGSVLTIYPTEPVLPVEMWQRTDAEAIAGDWKAIGGDMQWAIEHVEQP